MNVWSCRGGWLICRVCTFEVERWLFLSCHGGTVGVEKFLACLGIDTLPEKAVSCSVVHLSGRPSSRSRLRRVVVDMSALKSPSTGALRWPGALPCAVTVLLLPNPTTRSAREDAKNWDGTLTTIKKPQRPESCGVPIISAVQWYVSQVAHCYCRLQRAMLSYWNTKKSSRELNSFYLLTYCWHANAEPCRP
jgi:hypothetical protein